VSPRSDSLCAHPEIYKFWRNMVPLKWSQRLVADLDVRTCKARLVNSICPKVPPALPRRQGLACFKSGVSPPSVNWPKSERTSGTAVVCADRASELFPVNTRKQPRPITRLLLSAANKNAIIPYTENLSVLVTQVLGREKLLNVEIGFF
jgi:hypothetical protein